MIIIITIVIIIDTMSLLYEIENNKGLRKIFGERELVIMRKQLLGVKLKPSEKTRLSRDIKKKLEAILSISPYAKDFDFKKGKVVKDVIDDVIEVIKDDKLFHKIKRILLFGSHVSKDATLLSDIDIAVEFDRIDQRDAAKFRVRISGGINNRGDIQVLNVLPDKVKNSIEKNHKVLFKNG